MVHPVPLKTASPSWPPSGPSGCFPPNIQVKNKLHVQLKTSQWILVAEQQRHHRLNHVGRNHHGLSIWGSFRFDPLVSFLPISRYLFNCSFGSTSAQMSISCWRLLRPVERAVAQWLRKMGSWHNCRISWSEMSRDVKVMRCSCTILRPHSEVFKTKRVCSHVWSCGAGVQKHLCAYVKNCITDTATIGEEPDEPLSIESSVILKELVGYSVL